MENDSYSKMIALLRELYELDPDAAIFMSDLVTSKYGSTADELLRIAHLDDPQICPLSSDPNPTVSSREVSSDLPLNRRFLKIQ